MRRALAGLLLVFAAPLAAHEPGTGEYRSLHQLDRQLFEIGWKLARANAPYCHETAPSLGLQLHDVATYPDPALARATFDLTGDIGVLAVAMESPAQQAGVTAGATLDSINAIRTADLARTDPSWQRLDGLRGALTHELGLTVPAVVGWTGPDGKPHAVAMDPVETCRSRFEIAAIGERATADGERVVFGPGFPGFGYPEDEFAAAVAHELAHNLLGHRAWLDANGRSRKNIRRTEREADRLAPWLLVNAGYEAEAMIRLLERLRPGAGGNFLFGRTHRGWDERAEIIAAEIDGMRELADGASRADWSLHFARETSTGR